MRTTIAAIAVLGFLGAALAGSSASAQVAFDRPDAYTGAYGNRYGLSGDVYGYDRATVRHLRHHSPGVR